MCTAATVRSHRLSPGQQTQIDVTFYTRIDGPGRHGEIVRLFTNDPVATRAITSFPLKTEVAFYITVNDR